MIPALYNLAATDLLPDKFCVVGVARKAMSNDALRDSLMKGLRKFATRPVDDAIAERLLGMRHLHRGRSERPASFDAHARTARRSSKRTRDNRRQSAVLSGDAARRVRADRPRARPHRHAEGRTAHGGGWWSKSRSAPISHRRKALNGELLKIVDEHQIYRIDHYLGKETVQNILVLRFANGMFEPIWNRNHIDHVQITVDEKLGVGHRGSFYDATGALRDMVPNHLFQLLSLVAMEPPIRFDAHSVRSEKAEVLAAIQTQSEAEALQNSVRGQYPRRQDRRHRDRRTIARPRTSSPDSTTETYAALKLTIDNWRWAGVPFYLRTGKALGTKRTEIAIKFKQAPFAMFRDTPVDRLSQNYLVICDRADRGHHAAVQHQGAGAGDRHRRRRDEVPLQGLFQGRAEHRL